MMRKPPATLGSVGLNIGSFVLGLFAIVWRNNSTSAVQPLRWRRIHLVRFLPLALVLLCSYLQKKGHRKVDIERSLYCDPQGFAAKADKTQ